MAQTRSGAIKIAAKRVGVPVDEYLAHMAIGEKWCYSCKRWHSRSIFTIDRSRHDGLAATCRGYNPKSPVTQEQKRLRKNAAYRHYYATNGGPSIRARKQARKRNCERVSPTDRERVFDRFEGMCAYCGSPAYGIDHVVAVKKGGGSRRGNLLPACRSCNSKKRTRDLDEFLSIAPNPSDLIAEELCMEYVL
jgi:hypothetical protein